MTWPSPPRCIPAPPESGRSSLRQMTIGPTCSVASTDMVRTPLGKAVALSPSRRGRAPVPPLLNIKISAGGRSRPPPSSAAPPGEPALSAGAPLSPWAPLPEAPPPGAPLPERAPAPPGAATARAPAWKFHSAPEPSAGTMSGKTSARAPRHRSVTKWPITWRTDTGSGGRALRMHPAGALTVNGASEAALLGVPGASAHSRP